MDDGGAIRACRAGDRQAFRHLAFRHLVESYQAQASNRSRFYSGAGTIEPRLRLVIKALQKLSEAR